MRVLLLSFTIGRKQIDTNTNIDKIKAVNRRLFRSLWITGGTVHFPISHVTNLYDALTLIDSGVPQIISRVPTPDLFDFAGMVRGGVYDFCGTLITDSQWRAFEALMSDESKRLGKEAIDWYHTTRNNGNAPDDLENEDWLLGAIMEENIAAVDAALALLPIMRAEKDGVLIADVIKAGAELAPREGAYELMDTVGPALICSFGIEQMIRGWQERYDVACPVAAIRLGVDEQMRVKACNMNLVLPMTKALAAARWRELSDLHPEQVLSIGDTIFDTNMMHPDGFNVLIIPPGEVDKKVAAFREGQLGHMWEKLTMVLFDDDLATLADLVEMGRTRLGG